MSTGTLRVVDVMTSDVVTIGRNEHLATAADIMQLGRIRHLPVVDEEGELAGIVSQRDLFHSGLLKALGYGLHARQVALGGVYVKEAMVTEIVTVGPETPLREAAKTMLDRKIGCVVVVRERKAIGILTESDFVKLALKGDP